MEEVVVGVRHNSGNGVEVVVNDNQVYVDVTRYFKGGSSGEAFKLSDPVAMQLRDALCLKYGLPGTPSQPTH